MEQNKCNTGQCLALEEHVDDTDNCHKSQNANDCFAHHFLLSIMKTIRIRNGCA